MSLELAQKFGYKLVADKCHKGSFQLPDGSIIQALGRVTGQVQFIQGEGARLSTFTCHFNFFSRLALPALIGMAFLRANRALTTRTSR